MSIRVVFDPSEDPYALWLGESDDSDGLWIALTDLPAVIAQLRAVPTSPDYLPGKDEK